MCYRRKMLFFFFSCATTIGDAEPSWSPVGKEESWRKPSPTWEVPRWPHPHPHSGQHKQTTFWSCPDHTFTGGRVLFFRLTLKTTTGLTARFLEGAIHQYNCPPNPYDENLEMFRKYVFLRIKITYFLVLKRKIENSVNQNSNQQWCY